MGQHARVIGDFIENLSIRGLERDDVLRLLLQLLLQLLRRLASTRDLLLNNNDV